MRSFGIQFVTVLWFFIGTTASAAANCSTELDESVLSPTLDSWNGGFVSFLVGRYNVHARETDYLNGLINTAMLEEMRAAQLAGLLNIQSDEVNLNESSSWSAWMDAVEGIKATVESTPTPALLELDEEVFRLWGNRRGSQFYKRILIGSFEFKNITRTQNIENKSRRLGLIFFTYTVTWSEKKYQYMQARRELFGPERAFKLQCLSELRETSNRKARVLLELDEFTCKWKSVAEDVADVDRQFCSRYVDRILGSLNE